MLKNCQNCIHKKVCGLKEKYNQYVNEMKVMKEKYPEMGFTTDCPSWRFENEVGVNKCNTCKYKKQVQDDRWNPLVHDGERIKNAKIFKTEDIKDREMIKEPYTVTYINREDTKEEIDNNMWMQGEKYTLDRKDKPKYVCIPSTPARNIEDIKKEEDENIEKSKENYDIIDFIYELLCK